MKEVESLLGNDEDLVQLYLTSPEREVTDHTELELIFESYYADFEEIVAEIKTVKDTIEDTNQFISAHLDSVRNKMLRLSLMLEMGALALGSGAVVGGVFWNEPCQRSGGTSTSISDRPGRYGTHDGWHLYWIRHEVQEVENRHQQRAELQGPQE